jgi:hypothetical protein
MALNAAALVLLFSFAMRGRRGHEPRARRRTRSRGA